MTTTLLDLGQFTGSERCFRHALVSSVTYTEGARYLAETAGAYWLLDKIAIVGTMDPALKDEPWQSWRLDVGDRDATITVDDGNDRVLYREKIEFTDFPAPGVTLWFIDGVILLPSEY